MRITIPATVAHEIAALKTFADTGGLTPILDGIHITHDEKHGWRAYATDRFAVGCVAFEPLADSEPGSAIIPAREFAAAVRGIKRDPNARVTITADAADGTGSRASWALKHGSTAIGGHQTYGNFPALARLFPTQVTATPACAPVSAELLSRLNRWERDAGIPERDREQQPWSFASVSSATPEKPGPILATRGNVAVLIQPNLLRMERGKRPETLTIPGHADATITYPAEEAEDVAALRAEIAELRQRVADAETERDRANERAEHAEATAEELRTADTPDVPTIDTFRNIPDMTEKMAQRAVVAAALGKSGDDVALYVLGTTRGKRADALRAIIDR